MSKRLKNTVLDLFCGCGGISYGFHLAGFEIIGGVDFNEDATKTFKHNFKSAKMHHGYIEKISDEEILRDYAGVDIIVGGPPCQGFSSANRWQKEEDDPRNKLFFEYIRFVKLLRPKVILIENVRGILTRNDGFAKERISTILGEEGYNISMQVLDASDYGVPQNRKRAFFVGIRKDYKDITFDFANLVKQPKVTVEDAIGEFYVFEQNNPDEKILLGKPSTPYRKYLRATNNVVLSHDARYPAEIVQKRISFVPQGGNWKDVPAELWKNNRQNRHSSAYKRLDPTTQSCTIDTGNAHSNYFHPIYNRIPSVRESARLQSFSDRFEFLGSRGSQYKQVGNAVPPLLAKAIADEILKIIEDENN